MNDPDSRNLEAADLALEPEVQPSTEERLALIHRLARSEHFSRAARLRNLLLYIGNESVKKGTAEIKEHEIGVNVFGRSASYDPSQDNIVRVNASEMRKRLETYFAHEGAQESLVVEVPRGGYKAVFRRRTPTETVHTPPPPVPTEAQPVPQPIPLASGYASPPIRPASSDVVRAPGALKIAVAIPGLLLLIASCVLWQQNRALRQTLYPWRQSPALAALWSNFLDSGRATDVIPADQGLLLVEQLRNQQVPFEAYQNRSFMNAPAGPAGLSDTPHVEAFVFGKNLVSTSDCVLVSRILALDPAGTKMVLYNARHYSVDLLKRDNLIVIGGPIANPWDQLFESHLNFEQKADLNTPGSVEFVNHAPHPGERASYPEDAQFGYGLVAFLPNPGGSGHVLLIQGTDPEAAQATSEFLLSEGPLAAFLNTIQTKTVPYFEVLLKVARVHGSSPLSSSVEAYRTYPKLQR